jgi:integrase/recombinase XerD
MLDQQVQRAVRAAGRRAGLSCTVTPHSLRHAYATHALHSGAYIRDIQVALGHRSLETTMGYCHADVDRVRSPLETIAAVAIDQK